MQSSVAQSSVAAVEASGQRQATAAPADAPVVETPGGYGLLSGAGEGSLERERAALDAQTGPVRGHASAPRDADGAGAHALSRILDRDRPITLPWVLLLATALGLACGCIIGLLTVA
ncbi:hypothetical protein BJF85_08355 [Saccharomonospora sp. CUA-673]|nr:hypothetical protein BJF85_08355 [Saccharomonospora sp. CUA-673]